MLFAPILDILHAVLSWIVHLLPAYTGYPSEVTSAISYFAGKAYSFNCILPMSDILAIALIEMSIAAALLLFRFFTWIFHWRQ